jgi:hypothetical protein
MNYNIVPTTGTRAKSLEKAYGSKCRKSRDDAGVVFHRPEGGPNYLRAFFRRTPGPSPFSRWTRPHRLQGGPPSFARQNWVRFAKKRPVLRFCFGGFRSRTPGPPPFSSMNSMPADPKVGSRRAGLRSRQKDWVRFVKRSRPVLTASAWAAFEAARLVRHRSRR